MCISYKNEISFGESWTATITPITGIRNTKKRLTSSLRAAQLRIPLRNRSGQTGNYSIPTTPICWSICPLSTILPSVPCWRLR